MSAAERSPDRARPRNPLPSFANQPTGSLSSVCLGWGGVRAGLDLVAAGLTLVFGSSTAVLVSAWMAEGDHPSASALFTFGGTAGELIRVLILAGAVIGFVLIDAGMCLGWTVPAGEPACRVGRWLPACVALKALVILWVHSVGSALPFGAPAYPGLVLFLRVFLLLTVGLQTAAFFLFLKDVAHSIRANRLARTARFFLFGSMGVWVSALLLAVVLEEYGSASGGFPKHFICFYLLPLLDVVDSYQVVYDAIPFGYPKILLYLVLGAATALLGGCALLVLWARQALTRALLPAEWIP